eukprot:6186632-Pleurochrysis_carterae.AAC.2
MLFWPTAPQYASSRYTWTPSRMRARSAERTAFRWPLGATWVAPPSSAQNDTSQRQLKVKDREQRI